MPVLGCRVRFNSLMEGVLPFSFECTVEGRVSSPGDMTGLAVEAASILGSMLGARFAVEGPRHWEFSGRRFNLYSYQLVAGGQRPAGVIRVVEAGGEVVNVTGAFAPGEESVAPGLVEARERGSIEDGYNLGIILLRSGEEREDGVPPGQKLVRDFAIYAVEGIQELGGDWRLRVEGSVSKPLDLGLSDLLETINASEERDFHCVTGWSVAGVEWSGVRLQSLLKAAGAPREGWLAAVSSGGYVAVVPMREAWRPEAMLALLMNGRPLPKEHGYPARLMLPRLYGWKHAKWVTRLVALKDYQDGYWEALSYHERGLAAAEERFKVRNPRIAEEGLPRSKPRPLRPIAW